MGKDKDGPDNEKDQPRQGAIPPLDDPAEAVERIVPRRQLLFEDGDVIIVQASGSAVYLPQQRVYGLRIRGSGPVAGRYVSFEHAVVAGEELAMRRGVRLFYIDGEGEAELPHLLKDYRPSR